MKKIDLFEILFKQLPKKYSRTDYLLHMMIVYILCIFFILHIINSIYFHFTEYFGNLIIICFPGLLIFWIIGKLFQHKKTGLLLYSLSQVIFFFFLVEFLIPCILTTPFSTIDHFLYRIDLYLGFSVLDFMNWTSSHHTIKEIYSFAYNTWIIQLLGIPLILSVFKEQYEIDFYILTTFVSFFIGGMIYYFFPTVAPAGILKSPHFFSDQYDLVKRFYEIHQHAPISTLEGGVVAFPSFHVINVLLGMYVCRTHRIILCILLFVNSILILATMALGYHYLTDVIGGFLVAFISIGIGHTFLTTKNTFSK